MACLNPVYISRPRKNLVLPGYAGKPSSEIERVCRECNITNYFSGFVPCGKCSDCLKRRQQDLAARCAAEAQIHGNMTFVTLTYREDTLPFAVRLLRVDKETGEIFSDFSLKHCVRRSRYDSETPFHLDIRAELSTFSKGYRTVYRDFFEDDEYLYRYLFTPTLHNRDVRLWLKRCRVRYERVYKCKLPDFKYVVCGEYGNHGSKRPHYHICFFGLTVEQVRFMTLEWNNNLGFTYVQQVNCINEDGSDGFALASRYIGKYMTKGLFDSQMVRDGYAFKGRLMSSKHLGGKLSETLVNYFRCYDIVGKYDLMDLLDKDKLSLLVREMSKRMTLTIGKSIFRIPGRFKKQIWYVKDSLGRLQPSVVSRQISNAVSRHSFDEFIREYSKFYPDVPMDEVIKKALEHQDNQAFSSKLKDEHGMFAHQKFYLSSNF